MKPDYKINHLRGSVIGGENLSKSTRSKATQTKFRESETQTLPCTIGTRTDGVLAGLKYGHGLPVRTYEDLAIVDAYRRYEKKIEGLPPTGDPRRLPAERRLIEARHSIQRCIENSASRSRQNFENERIQESLELWTQSKERKLKERLDRIADRNRKEKILQDRVIEKSRRKKMKNLETKTRIVNERLLSSVDFRNYGDDDNNTIFPKKSGKNLKTTLKIVIRNLNSMFNSPLTATKQRLKPNVYKENKEQKQQIYSSPVRLETKEKEALI